MKGMGPGLRYCDALNWCLESRVIRIPRRNRFPEIYPQYRRPDPILLCFTGEQLRFLLSTTNLSSDFKSIYQSTWPFSFLG